MKFLRLMPLFALLQGALLQRAVAIARWLPPFSWYQLAWVLISCGVAGSSTGAVRTMTDPAGGPAAATPPAAIYWTAAVVILFFSRLVSVMCFVAVYWRQPNPGNLSARQTGPAIR